MEIQQIKYFLVLAKELHFWNTALKIHITQSALSRQIQSLENELGVLLFYRDKRNVKLTPAGKFLQEKWEKEIIQFEAFTYVAKQIHLGESGTIRIAYPDSISSSIMPIFIKKIAEQFPKLKLELLQLPFEIQEEYLKNFKIDLAFTRDTTQSSFVEVKKINEESLAFVVPENHSFRLETDISTLSLQEQNFILATDDQSSSYNALIQEVMEAYQIPKDSYINCEFGSTIIALIKNGLGISILPYSYKLHENKGVRFIPIPFQTHLYVHWRKDDPNPILKNILKSI